MSSLPLFQADAFAARPFAGNPAAVCLLPFAGAGGAAIPDATLLAIAAEMNLSETAFPQALSSRPDAFVTDDRFGLRWFTPVVEVSLCGHATLATAAVLFYQVKNINTRITFDTMSGPLVVEKDEAQGPGGVMMTFPSNSVAPVSPAAQAIHALIAEKALTGSSVEVASLHYSLGTKKLLIRLADGTTRAQLEAISPDQAGMHSVDQSSLSPSERVTGVAITAVGDGSPSGGDFMSRYFTPWNGIPEDPVNGSSHTALGPYWADVLGKPSLRAVAASKRSGDIAVEVLPGCAGVKLGGRVAFVFNGEFALPTPA